MVVNLGEPHGTGPGHPIVRTIVRDMILGTETSTSSTASPPPTASTPAPTASTQGPSSTTGSGTTTVPNPGGPASQLTLTIPYTWSQEPSGYDRYIGSHF